MKETGSSFGRSNRPDRRCGLHGEWVDSEQGEPMADVPLILILILGGLALIVAEICTPAFGMLAVAALGCFVAAAYHCFQIHPIFGFLAVLVLLVGLPVYLAYMIKLFPKTPLGKRLTIREVQGDVGAGVPETKVNAALLGAEGITLSVLRPSGTVKFDDRRIVGVAESGFLPAGTRVRVVKSAGMNVIVRAVEADAEA
ncbi:MAG: hypothetical protein E4H17_03930 [Gemmatimonadales bacterium]|nr:MAG: hypothetical protein E4H17_03930 [Gemmatimonadales bacterium]